MRETRIIMGMPITIGIVGDVNGSIAASAFQYFQDVDVRFSPYKSDSELSAMNRGEISPQAISLPMQRSSVSLC